LPQLWSTLGTQVLERWISRPTQPVKQRIAFMFDVA